ncbi:MAG: glycosyltransferase family 2 protein [Methanobacterium paludis]|nr:glycosyltransferase family 2 protein [Methanobacterium paludis]
MFKPKKSFIFFNFYCGSIIVVDNSADKTSEELKKLLPDYVEIIENEENLGFSKANNQGLKISQGKYVLLLNNDAFVNVNCLEKGIKYLENMECPGIWAPSLIGENGDLQGSTARFPSLKDLIGEYFLFRHYNVYEDFLQWKEPKEVDMVIGAFMLMEKKLVDKVGLLDENFFFNAEDVDYCKRVHDSGFPVIYDPRVSITHIGGASQEDKWFKDPYLHKTRIIYSYKHYNFFEAFLSEITIKLGLIFRKFLWWLHKC